MQTTPEPRSLRPEAALLVDCSMGSVDDRELERFWRELGEDAFDWGFFLDQSIRHRVAAAVGEALMGVRHERISQMHLHALRALYFYNRNRNTEILREQRVVLRALEEHKIRVLVRKGGLLAVEGYRDGVRYLTDLDLMTQRQDLPAITEVLASLGYRQGTISANHRVLLPLTRRAEVFWSLNMASAPQFVRMAGDTVDFYYVEPRFNIVEPAFKHQVDMADWFDRAQRVSIGGTMAWVPARDDFLIDVLVHLYKEAISIDKIKSRNDLCLSRFADVAVCLSTPSLRPASDTFVHRVEELGLQREVFFGLFHASLLYPAAVPAELVDRLRPSDTSYLSEYGQLDDDTQSWDRDFLDRLFDPNRAAKVLGESKLIRQ